MELDAAAFIADSELIRELADRSLPIFCGENRILIHQGDDMTGLYILDRGVATLTMSASQGGKIASAQAYAGSIFGLPALIFNEPASRTVIAGKGAEVSFVTRADFNRLVQSNPRLSLLGLLAKEIRFLNRTVLRSSEADAVVTRFPVENGRKGYPQIGASMTGSTATGF